MTKEEKIKEAYGEHYWLYADCENAGEGYIIMAEDLDSHNIWKEIPLEKHSYINRAYRPLSLKGIENNNGWVKIENKEGLPKNDLEYKIGTMVNNKFYLSRGVYEKEEVIQSWYSDKITHYKSIRTTLPIY